MQRWLNVYGGSIIPLEQELSISSEREEEETIPNTLYAKLSVHAAQYHEGV
jgi:hypothetical protein